MDEFPVIAYKSDDYGLGLQTIFRPVPWIRDNQLFLRRNSELFIDLTGKDLVSMALITDGLHYHGYRNGHLTPWESRNYLKWFRSEVEVLRGSSEVVKYGISPSLGRIIEMVESDEIFLNTTLFFFADIITLQEAEGFVQGINLSYCSATLEMRM